MDIQSSKIALVKMILNIENAAFIEKIKIFVMHESIDFWNDLSLEEQNEIHLGIEQLDNGKRIAFEDVLMKIS
ncbi:MAG: hypothetical protein ABIO60_12940 [Aquaticitalea sp.]